jgi:RNA polymerase sigma-70 factor, ECF subfamily
MADQESEGLVRRLAAGDREALGQFYDRHARLVWSLAVRILRDQADAEDVAQEVFVQAWQQAARFDPARGSVEAWLCIMTRSRALDRLRRRASRREEPETATEVRTEAPQHERAIAVRNALEGLPREQRLALELAYYEGLTHTEIAERLGEPLGTIKTRIRTAMIKIRGLLESPA